MNDEIRRHINRLDADDEETLRLAKEHADNSIYVELLMALGGHRDEPVHDRIDLIEMQIGDIGELSVAEQIRYLPETAQRTDETAQRTEAMLKDIARTLYQLRFKVDVLALSATKGADELRAAGEAVSARAT